MELRRQVRDEMEFRHERNLNVPAAMRSATSPDSAFPSGTWERYLNEV